MNDLISHLRVVQKERGSKEKKLSKNFQTCGNKLRENDCNTEEEVRAVSGLIV